EQAFVHVDVNDLRARLDLLARDVDGGGVVAVQDQLLELGRAGDVGPFADIDERRGPLAGHVRSPLSQPLPLAAERRKNSCSSPPIGEARRGGYSKRFNIT